MKKEILTLKGQDIDLIYGYDNSLPLVIFRLVFRASGDFRSSKAGVAKIVSALLEEGSKKNSKKFINELEKRAISLSFEAGFETFVVEISCLKEQFSKALGFLKEILKEPNFTEESLKKVKTIQKGTLLALKNNFDYMAQLSLSSILYEDKLKQRSIFGTLESVDSIELQDVKNFFDTLCLSNLFVVLGGDVALKREEIAEALDSLPVGKAENLPFFKTSSKEEVLKTKEMTNQAYIYFGAPYFVERDEKYLADVATFILGSGGFGSRLMEEVRVKNGLAYSIYARNDLKLSSRSILGYMQTKNSKKDEALALIKEEFSKFVKFGVDKTELEQAKNFLKGSLVLRKETFLKRLNIAQGEYYDGYKFGKFDEEIEKIISLSLDRLNGFIKEHEEITKLSFAMIYNED